MDIDTPATEITITSKTEFSAVACADTKTFMVDLTLTAPASDLNEKRAPVSLIAVVDTSGSMRGQKLNLVQDSLEFVLGQLQPTDSFCLVNFGGSAQVLHPLKPMTSVHKPESLHACDKLLASGGTNMLSGLKVGLEQVPMTGISTVLLFTDGRPNTPTGVRELIQPALSKVKGGCTLHTFGYGTDHDAAFLRGLAEEGKGDYYFLEKPDDIPSSFADVLGGLLSVVAQNIVLEIVPCENVKLAKFHTTFDVTQNHQVKIPDLYAEEKRDILIEVTVSSTKSPMNQPLFKSTLSYFSVVSSTMHTSEPHITQLNRETTLNNEQKKVDLDVDEQRNRVVCANVLRDAQKAADAGELEKARAQLHEAIGKIKSTSSAARAETQLLLADLTEAADSMQQKSTYMAVGQKKMNVKQQMHSKQRAQVQTPSVGYKMNKAKCEMQEASVVVMSELTDERYARRQAASGAQTNTQSRQVQSSVQDKKKVASKSRLMNRIEPK